MKHPSARSLRISTRMVEALRHSPNLRESDGAIFWKMLMQRCRGFEDTVTWTFGDWMTCLDNGTDQLRFEYCLGRNRDIQYMRSVQGHSGGQQIDLQNNVLLPSVWSDCMYHEGSSFEWRSMSHRRRNRSSRRTTDMLLNSRSLGNINAHDWTRTERTEKKIHTN